MSGALLKETLKQLGYPKAKSLDSLDWIFENEAVVPFLEWFCNNVTQENVLKPKDLEEYKTLCQDDILDVEQLDAALRSLHPIEEEEQPTEESLRKEIDMLTSDCQTYQKRKHSLMQRRNMLSLHQTGQVHRLSKLDKVESKVKGPYKQALKQCHSDNAEMNTSIETLVELVGKLNALYELPLKPLDEAAYPMFLSQLSLDQYTSAEDSFASELTAFTKRQFFEGIAEIAGQTASSEYEFLDVSGIEKSLVTGGSQEDHVDQCRQLARIQNSYPKAKTELLNAKLTSKSRVRSIQTAEDILQSLQRGEFTRDINKIKKLYEDVKNNLQVVDRDLNSIMQQELPSLIQQSTANQVSKILTGDYNLKLARQNYFITNQDKLIQQLVSWRSRNEFLTMAYDVEIRSHRNSYHLMKTVQEQLQTHLKVWQDRMKMMEDPLLTPAKYQRGTVDSRDTFTTHLYKMIDISESKGGQQLFLTYSALTENVGKLCQKYREAKSNMALMSLKQEETLKSRERKLQSCEKSLYSGSSTTGGTPTLTHPDILSAFTKLENQMKKLNQSIRDICTDIDKKKQFLKSDRMLLKERKLFLYFFSDPSRLRQIMEEKSAELHAQKVH